MKKDLFHTKKCPICNHTFHTLIKTKKYCSNPCSIEAQFGKKEVTNPYNISTNRLGTVSELFVSTLLELNSYDVYKAISSHSKIDIIAINEKRNLLIEVRTGRYNFNKTKINYPNKVHSNKVNVIAVYTYEDSKVHFFDLNGKKLKGILEKTLGKANNIIRVE